MKGKEPRVVIVGGGFGGLSAARALAKAPVQVTLIDRSNHHLFQPLLYQVASAVLAPGDIAEPIRAILAKQRNVEVLLAEVQCIDTDSREVITDQMTVAYDHLVVAAGARTDYFGQAGWEERAPGLKTLDDALRIRQRVLLAFEKAEWCEQPEERASLLTFVVIGGGPTGVEMAGALCEIARHTLCTDFRHIEAASARVVLVEGGEEVLGSFDGRLPQRARQHLEDVGVELRLAQRVQAIDERGVSLSSGERIDASTVVWAAGVRGVSLGEQVGGEVDRRGRVMVAPDLTVPGDPSVSVIGDLAHFHHDLAQPLPGVAQVAIQMGACAAKNILRRISGQQPKPFKYWDLGGMATVGRKLAVAEIGGLRLSGLLAWLVWLVVHLMALVGFRNRLVVLTQWAWMYMTYQRNSRLIRADVPATLDT